MSLPEPVEKAVEELRCAQAAGLLVQAAGLKNDAVELRMYADQMAYALKRSGDLLDEWFTLGAVYAGGDDSDGPF